MLILNSIPVPTSINNPPVEALIQQRIMNLVKDDSDYDLKALGKFIYIEITDTDDDCRHHQPSLLSDRNGIEFGQHDYYSPYEFCIDHGDCYELVWIFSDDGSGIVVFVPKEASGCPLLLQLCQSIAINQEVL